MQFDRTSHVVISNGLVCFGNSVDGKVYALDAETGREKWSFFTDGPVRFAPAIWKDRLFVGSDDGNLYCLSLADGSLIRKLPGSPHTDRVLGNEHIIARRPLRGGPVILDDVLYFAAGIWQSEGIYLHAIDPESGKSLWTNDSSGGIYMPQPHGGANAKSGVSAQGYLVAEGLHLFVPTGRAVPAVFHRADGKFNYYHLQANAHRGGTTTMALGDFLYNGGYAYEAKTGALIGASFGEGEIAAFAGGILHAGKGQLQAYKPARGARPRERGPCRRARGAPPALTPGPHRDTGASQDGA
jgi:outer membrane protein assembly factor BamB